MGTSVVRPVTFEEIASLQARIGQASQMNCGLAPGAFVFMANFDGTNNDRNNLSLSGSAYQANVANIQDQTFGRQIPSFQARYYPGVGTGGIAGGLLNAGIFPTEPLRQIAVRAYNGSAMMFVRALDERGLKLPDGTVVAPPGAIPVTAQVLFDPSHAIIQGDLSLPPNVRGKVLVIAARDASRRLPTGRLRARPAQQRGGDWRQSLRRRWRLRAAWHVGRGAGDRHPSDAASENLAAALTVAAHREGLARIDVVAPSTDAAASRVLAAQDPGRWNSKLAEVPTFGGDGDVDRAKFAGVAGGGGAAGAGRGAASDATGAATESGSAFSRAPAGPSPQQLIARAAVGATGDAQRKDSGTRQRRSRFIQRHAPIAPQPAWTGAHLLICIKRELKDRLHP